MQNERRLHTYAVLIVDVVDLVDPEPLPLVQLLLLQSNQDISHEKPLRYSLHAQNVSNEDGDDSVSPGDIWLPTSPHL